MSEARINEELKCDDVVVTQVRGERYPFSAPKESFIPDVPDRRYYARTVAFWWEVKTKDDKLSEGQYKFLKREYDHGGVVGAGDHKDLLELMLARPSEWRFRGWETILRIKQRGFRKEKE